MDEAGQASTDYTDYLPSDALKESIMSKLNFTVYPLVAALSLAAAFSAHAQSANDPTDQAAYGAMAAAPVSSAKTATAAPLAAKRLLAAVAKQDVRDFDPVDHAGYGPMVANTASVRTRAEVRAEAIAARNAGYDSNYREGGDAGYAYATPSKAVAGDAVLAGVATQAAK
jgi:hypothetical protein